MAKKLPEIRKLLGAALQQSKKKKCGVLLSAGVDSHSVLHACLDVGIKPIVISFTRDDRESRDFRSAKDAAQRLGLEFVPVVLKSDVDTLKKYVVHAAKFGVRGKAAFECLYPMFCVARLLKSKGIKLDFLFSGYGADAFFALSKKGCMHYRDRMAEYALESHTRYVKKGSQLDILKRYFKEVAGLNYTSPWCDPSILKAFTSTVFSHDDLNKPKQKWPVRRDFKEEFSKAKIYNHTNYQLGDSGISEMFLQLLEDSDFNSAGFKSTTGVFNAVVKSVQL